MTTNPAAAQPAVLRAVDLTVGYGSEPVLRGVNLTVESGQFLGLQSPSGTGKSTLVRALALLLAPMAGRVEVDGIAINGTGFAVPRAIRQRIGIVFQSPRAATDCRLTLRQIIAEPLAHRAGKLRPTWFGDEVLQLAHAVHLTEDLLSRRPHQVSDGQLQRACVARAMALRPEVLLCDEPTAALDPPTAAAVVAAITTLAVGGTAVVFASHDQRLLSAAADRTVHLADLQA